MRLVNFSISNYRSITKAHKIKISDLTVLIGKNNEGKSNILKALTVAMNTLQAHGEARRLPAFQRASSEGLFDWDRDFPIELQARARGNKSIFRLEFELSEEELLEFKRLIKSNLNGTLPLQIRIGPDNQPSISVVKQGRGGKTLSAKSAKIAQFIADKIYFNHIPAVRTHHEAVLVIRDMLSDELRVLEENEDYRRALTTIAELQRPLLDSLAERIKLPLSEFLPNIKGVTIDVSETRRMSSLRRDIDVFIDDGQLTKIEYKGDGVKSLATLALLKNKHTEGCASVVAIEEPESHLHPAAIHQLRSVIFDLSRTNQVIISTHSPLFVDRNNMSTNIIIDNRRAKTAKNIKEIRELLGVQASDNLVNANYVLVVEGEDDVISLSALLTHASKGLATALRNNTLVLDHLGGAGNLPYKLSQLSNALCESYVFLDNDKAGQRAMEKAEKLGYLSLNRCTLAVCNGMKESEFEDVLSPDIYLKAIREQFGADLSVPTFRRAEQWSTRVGKAFREQGKPWTDSVEAKVKGVVADCVKRNPENALNPHKRSSFDGLVQALEYMITGCSR